MTAYYNENDPYAAQWLRNLIRGGHIAAGDVDERSIVDVRPDDLRGYAQCHFFAGIGGWSYALRLAGIPDDFPVWTGSCPCQPLSGAGQRKGHADERHLWPAFYRLIAECCPATVFGEQVASSDGREWLAGVRADLEGLGYAVGAADLCAAGIGAPHIRQRLYWVAEPEGEQRDGRGDAWRGRGELADGSGAHGLADATSARCNGALGGPEGEARHKARLLMPGESGAALRLAHADGWLARDGGLQRGGEHGQQPEDGRVGGVGFANRARSQSRQQAEPPLGHGSSAEPASHAGGVGDALGTGVRRESRNDGDATSEVSREVRQQWLRADVGPASAPFWSAFDLIPCTDGKARRVEPGSFPLAHGIPNRVGRLRAYGNAIIPQVAAEFIRAAMNVSGGNQKLDNHSAA